MASLQGLGFMIPGDNVQPDFTEWGARSSLVQL